MRNGSSPYREGLISSEVWQRKVISSAPMLPTRVSTLLISAVLISAVRISAVLI